MKKITMPITDKRAFGRGHYLPVRVDRLPEPAGAYSPVCTHCGEPVEDPLTWHAKHFHVKCARALLIAAGV